MSKKSFTTAVAMSFVLVASFVAGGCSSKKASADGAAADTAVKATTVAKNDVSLGGASSGRAR